MDEKNLKSLYDFAVSNKLDIGDYDSFKVGMQKPENRKSFHEFATENKLDIGGYDEFEGNWSVKKKDNSESSGQDGTSPSQTTDPNQTIISDPVGLLEKTIPPNTIDQPSGFSINGNPVQYLEHIQQENTPFPSKTTEDWMNFYRAFENTRPVQTSLMSGITKSFNQGTADVLHTLGYVTDKLADVVGDPIIRAIGGEDAIKGKNILRETGITDNPFNHAAKMITERSQGLQDAPDNLISNALTGIALMAPDLMGMFITPEIKTAGWLSKYLPKLSGAVPFLASKGGAQAAESVEGGTPTQQIIAPLVGAARGTATGLTFELAGKMSSQLGAQVAEKMFKDRASQMITHATVGTLANATTFGGLTAADEFLATGQVDMKNVLTQAGIGVLFGVKDLGGALIAKGYSTISNLSSKQISDIHQSKSTPAEIQAKAEETIKKVPQQKPKTTKREAISQTAINTEGQGQIETFISQDTRNTLLQLEQGRPVTNDVLKQASDNLYGEYKRLNTMKKGILDFEETTADKFVVDQLNKQTNELGEKIDLIESMRQRQASPGEFANESHNADIMASTALSNVAAVKAVTEDILENPNKHIELLRNSNLPEVPKQELIDKVNQIVADNDPKHQQAKPIEDRNKELSAQIEKITLDNSRGETEKKAMISPLQEEIKANAAKVNEIYNPTAGKQVEPVAEKVVVATTDKSAEPVTETYKTEPTPEKPPLIEKTEESPTKKPKSSAPKPNERIKMFQGGRDNLATDVYVDPAIKKEMVDAPKLGGSGDKPGKAVGELPDAIQKIGRVHEGTEVDMRGMSRKEIIDLANGLDELKLRNERKFGGKWAEVTIAEGSFGKNKKTYSGMIIGENRSGVTIKLPDGTEKHGKTYKTIEPPKTEPAVSTEPPKAPIEPKTEPVASGTPLKQAEIEYRKRSSVRKEKLVDLDQRRKEAMHRLKKSSMGVAGLNNFKKTAESYKAVGELIGIEMESGVIKLTDAIDKVFTDLKVEYANLTRKDVEDAAIEYSKIDKEEKPIEPKESPVVESSDPFTIKQKNLENIREKYGLGEQVREVVSDPEVIARAEKMMKDKVDASDMIQRAKKGEALNAEQQAYLGMLINGLDKTAKTDADYILLRDAIDALHIARAVGGRAERFGRVELNPESSASAMIIQYMNETGVDKLTTKEKIVNEKQFKFINDKVKKLEALTEKQAQEAAILKIKNKLFEREFNQDVKKTIEREKREERRQGRQQTIEQEQAERAELSKVFRKQMAQAGAFANPEAAVTAAKMIYKDIKIGSLKVADSVDRFYTEFKDSLEGVTKDDLTVALMKHIDELDAKLPTKKELLEIQKDLTDAEKAAKELEKLNSQQDPTTEAGKRTRNKRVTKAQKGDNTTTTAKENQIQKTIDELQEKLEKLERGIIEEPKSRAKNEVNEKIKELRKQIRQHELTRAQAKVARLKTAKADVAEQLASGNFQKPKLDPLKPTPEMRKLMDDLSDMRAERREMIELAKLRARSKSRKFWDFMYDLGFTATRTAIATLDVSASLLQGGYMVVTHPMASGRAFKASINEMVSETKYSRWLDDIKNDPYYPDIMNTGTAITDQRSKVGKFREELFAGKILESIPFLGKAVKIGGKKYGGLIVASGRQYSSILNHMRWDMSKRLVMSMEASGRTFANSKAEYREIGRYVNAATGRGDLFTLEEASKVVAGVLFAPRMYSGMIQTITGRSMFMGRSAAVRRMAIRDYVMYMGGIASFLLLAKGAQTYLDAPWEVELSTLSKNFGKVKIGGTWYGLPGGLTPYISLLARTAMGKEKTSSGDYVDYEPGWGKTNRMDALGRWARGKLSPPVSLAVDLASGSTYLGEDITWSGELYNRGIPMSLQSGITEARYNSTWQGVLDGAISATGLQATTIPPAGWYPKQTVSDGDRELNALGEDPSKGIDTAAWEVAEKYNISLRPPPKYSIKLVNQDDFSLEKIDWKQYLDFVQYRGDEIRSQISETMKDYTDNRKAYIDDLLIPTGDERFDISDDAMANHILDKVIIPNEIKKIIEVANTNAKSMLQGEPPPTMEERKIAKAIKEFKEKNPDLYPPKKDSEEKPTIDGYMKK